jgi:bacterioferritin
MAAQPHADLIELLNKGVARELQVAVQYIVQHTKMEKILQKVILENILIEPNTYDAMGAILRTFAIEEMKHAGAIMERIYYLGGHATTKATKVVVGETLSEFAKNNVKAEEEALELYRQVIDMAGKYGDFETRELFEKIYADEEKHLFKFQEYTNIEKDGDIPTAPPAEWTKIITPDYLKLLNKAVAGEMMAIVQYTNQHEKANKLAHRKKDKSLEVVTDKTKATVISDVLKKVFMQEMEHIEKIAERVFRLDGEAAIVPEPLPKVTPDSTPDQWLLDDRQAEDETIILYRQIIAEAEKIGDYVTRSLFERIIGEEDAHFFEFDDFFAKK